MSNHKDWDDLDLSSTDPFKCTFCSLPTYACVCGTRDCECPFCQDPSLLQVLAEKPHLAGNLPALQKAQQQLVNEDFHANIPRYWPGDRRAQRRQP